MAEWDYRAYDADRNIHEGKETAPTFVALALKLRQKHGLQILEATKLNKDSTLAAQRLAKMRARIGSEEVPKDTETITSSIIHKLLSWLISLFIRY